MKKYLGSKAFVIVNTVVTFIIGGFAGWLMAIQSKYLVYEFFNVKTAFGYWLLDLVMTLIVCLLSILVRKAYMSNNDDNKSEK